MTSESESELNCIICMEVYEEESHSPRTLRCGHTLCTPCLRALLDRPPGQRSCPECRHAIKITAVEHVAVSYAVLRLARALEQARLGASPVVTQESCPTHSRPLTARCTSAQRWVCHQCQCHPACTHLKPVGDALNEMKQKKVQETEKMMDQLGQVEAQLKKKRDDLTKQLEEVTKDLTRHSQLIGMLEESEARVVQASTPSIYTRAYTNHQNSLKEAVLFVNAHQTNATSRVRGRDSPVITPATPSPSPPLTAIITPEALKEKLRITQTLYAEREWYGEKKYARMKLQGSDLCMHALTDKQPPPDSSFISFWPLRQEWKDGHYQQRAFLDISIDGRVEGRVAVLLFLKSVRAEAFVDLCVGELGYSYKGLRLNFVAGESSSQAQMMVGEEFVAEEGGVHPAVSYHVSQYRDGGYYRRQVFPGLVAGAPAVDKSYLATFRIHMFHAKGRTDNQGFGKVESGLGLIRYAFNEDQMKTSTVADCGLLFSV